MEVEFMTAETILPPSMPLPVAALRQQHRKGYVCAYAGGCIVGRNRGRERDFIYPFSDYGIIGSAFLQPYDNQAFPERTGTSRADYACPSGHWETKQDLCTYPKDGGNLP